MNFAFPLLEKCKKHFIKMLMTKDKNNYVKKF